MLFKSFAITTITACILLLQVSAIPVRKSASPLVRRSKSTGKFLHITDIHIDPHYTEGTKTKNYCHSTINKSKRDVAGKYGALGSDCDSPIALVDATFDYLKNNVNDIDFIVYTGDTVRHDRDDNLPRTDDEVEEGHKSVLKYFQSAYDIDSIPFIPTIGNNDAYKHDIVTSKDSIFSTLKDIWEPLNLNLTSDFTKGGYFIQDVIPNQLSIVNMNAMYFYTENTAIDDCSSSSSPAAVHMAWLENILKTYSAKSGHKLYLMGHVPPTDDDGSKIYKSKCYSQYFNLLGKYSGVIAGHFTGHTNDDTLSAIYKTSSSYDIASPEDDNASKSNMAKSVVGLFNAPSIIPKNNPGFRVYTYETSSGSEYPVGTILDWVQYYVDLEEANSKDNVDYQVEYTASDLYNVDHFDGSGVGSAVYNVAKDSSSLDKYKSYMKVLS